MILGFSLTLFCTVYPKRAGRWVNYSSEFVKLTEANTITQRGPGDQCCSAPAVCSAGLVCHQIVIITQREAGGSAQLPNSFIGCGAMNMFFGK